MKSRLLEYLFPRKCVLCRRFLSKDETDLCPECRKTAPIYKKSKKSIRFIAHWTAVWYYRGNVRSSLLRYKFYGVRSYASAYGRLLAMRLLKEELAEADLVTWVPVSPQRKMKRGFDQVELIAKAVGRELDIPVVRCLRKVRNVGAQSRLHDASQRKANVLGAYAPVNRERFAGKRILMLDDIITTGATASECAGTLMLAGANEVICGAIAAAEK